MSALGLGSWLRDAYLLSVVSLFVAWLVFQALRHHRASVRHHVWVMALAVTLLSPLATLVVPTLDIPAPPWFAGLRFAVPSGSPSSGTSTGSVQDVSIDASSGRVHALMEAVVGVWLCGAMGILLVRVRRRHRLAFLCGHARIWPGAERVGVHDDVVVPMVTGFYRPTILLPAAALNWPLPEREAILTHERAHLARRDHVIALLSEAATTVYWLNPLVWVAGRALERDRERACDDAVLWAGIKSSVYAQALVRVADSLPSHSRTAGLLGMATNRLYPRVRHILADPRRHSGQVPLSWRSTALLVLIITFVITTTHLVSQATNLQADEIMGSVNGDPLTVGEVDRYGANLDPQLSPDERRSRALVNAVGDILVVQRAAGLGYELSDAQFASILANIKADNRVTSDAQFEAALKEAHLTVADLRRTLEHQVIVSRVRKSEASGIVTDDEAQRYYAAHKSEFPQRTFDQARESIKAALQTAGGPRRWVHYLESLESQARIEWRTPDLARLYADGLVQRANALQ